MLYAHLLLRAVVVVFAAFVSMVVAIFAVATVTGDLKEFWLVTAAIWVLLFFGLAYCLGHLASSVPSRCPRCKSWSAYMLHTHPISYRCSACGERTKLRLYFDSGLTQDCPSCAGRMCFEYTGSTIDSGPEPLLGFKCKKCGHLDYCVSPPPSMA